MDSQSTQGDTDLRRCGDEQLIAGLMRALRDERGMTARLVAFMGEVDARGLYRKYAYSSMFEYAVSALHMSEGEAYVRIHAARACRMYPVVLEMLARGELHLSGVRLLAPVLTAENHAELLGAMRFQSKREIERLLAVRFPKQDVRNEMRRLPGRALAEPTVSAATRSLEPARVQADAPGAQASLLDVQRQALDSAVPAARMVTRAGASCGQARAQDSTVGDRGGALAVGPMTAVPGSSAGSRTVAPAMAPLRDDRYKVQFTANQRLHDKIKQAQHLLRNQVPDGDLAEICERALDLLIAERMKQRFALGRRRSKAATPASMPVPTPAPGSQTPASQSARGFTSAPISSPAPAPTPAQRSNTRHIPNEVRRQVLARDGGRCAFVSELGRRCEERGGLEFHHKRPFARGGEASVANVCLLCRAHNGWFAEQDYGRAFMQRRITEGSAAKSATRPGDC